MTFPQSPRARLIALGSTVLAAAIALVAVLALTASAHGTARSSGTGVSIARGSVGSGHEKIAVSGGRAVYTLSSDTTAHRTCTRTNGCFSVWPPLTAHGAVPSHVSGLSGRLGMTTGHQLTLNGHPLYLFADDHARDSAHGDGIHSFGGTWHVVAGDDHGHHHGGASGGSGGSGGGYGGGTGGGW